MNLTKEEANLFSDKKAHTLTVLTILFIGLASYINQCHYNLFVVISKAVLFIVIIALSIGLAIMVYFLIYIIWKAYLSGKL